MALRHKAKYIDGKLKPQDREKFIKELESFGEKPFDIVLSKELLLDKDYLRRYYFKAIVEAYGNEVGLNRKEAHESLKELYGLQEREEVEGVSKLSEQDLQNAIELTCTMLSKFADATNLKTVRDNNKVFIEYAKSYALYTEKQALAYHNRCRDGLFKNVGMSIPKEAEVSV